VTLNSKLGNPTSKAPHKHVPMRSKLTALRQTSLCYFWQWCIRAHCCWLQIHKCHWSWVRSANASKSHVWYCL